MIRKPECLYLLSAWYSRDEIARRKSILYAGSLLSGAFGGLFAARITTGLARNDGLGASVWHFIIDKPELCFSYMCMTR